MSNEINVLEKRILLGDLLRKTVVDQKATVLRYINKSSYYFFCEGFCGGLFWIHDLRIYSNRYICEKYPDVKMYERIFIQLQEMIFI